MDVILLGAGLSKRMGRQKLLLQFGSGTVPSQAQLEQALATLDGKGSVSDESFELYGQFVQANGTDYQIVIYNPVVSLSSLNLKAWAVGIFFLMAVLLLLIIFLTNRFLTRFVFRRISEPLKTLSEGVHQIRDGNLSHRIAYSEKDEFLPICEDFNEMAERLRTSVRCMPWLSSGSSTTAGSSMGLEKAGQPQPLSNLSVEENSGSPVTTST